MHWAMGLALALVFTGGPDAQRPSAAQRARAGWEAINAGRARDAAAAFDDALKAAPQEPSLLLGAGLAAHLLGEGDAARRFLLDALKYEPALTTASLLLGDLLYRANDLDGAIDIYQKALVHAPEDRQLRTRLEAWRSEAALHDRFTRKLGDHFTVLFEGPAEAALAATAVTALEAAYWRIGSALYSYPTEVITVILYTREQFRDVTRAPDWAGGAYDGRIRVPVLGALENLPEFERVLTHEFVHALVRSIASGGVPQWLNEGIAVNFDGSALAPQLARLENADARPALATLEGHFGGLTGPAATLAYAESAAAVKQLLDAAGPSALVGLLEDVGRGVAFPEAFARHINITYEAFQKRR